MSNGCSTKNQTSKEVVEHLARVEFTTERGTGLFLVPDPEQGIMEYKKILVRDLTYTETCKRGANCEAFSFMPSAMMTYKQIRAVVCRGPCPGGEAYCQPGCLCSNWNSQCY
jgi:hypothetical protein